MSVPAGFLPLTHADLEQHRRFGIDKDLLIEAHISRMTDQQRARSDAGGRHDEMVNINNAGNWFLTEIRRLLS